MKVESKKLLLKQKEMGDFVKSQNFQDSNLRIYDFSKIFIFHDFD